MMNTKMIWMLGLKISVTFDRPGYTGGRYHFRRRNSDSHFHIATCPSIWKNGGSLWAEDIFWYHSGGIALVAILINYMILQCRISMIDVSKMGLVVNMGVQKSMNLSTSYTPTEKCYTEAFNSQLIKLTNSWQDNLLNVTNLKAFQYIYLSSKAFLFDTNSVTSHPRYLARNVRNISAATDCRWFKMNQICFTNNKQRKFNPSTTQNSEDYVKGQNVPPHPSVKYGSFFKFANFSSQMNITG